MGWDERREMCLLANSLEGASVLSGFISACFVTDKDKGRSRESYLYSKVAGP